MTAPAISKQNPTTTSHSRPSRAARSRSWRASAAASSYNHTASLLSHLGYCTWGSRSQQVQRIGCLAKQQHGHRSCTAEHCRAGVSLVCHATQQGASWYASGSAGEAASQSPAAAWAQPLDDPWAALLMAWFASRRRSRLAAQCLVESVLQLYMSGNTFTQVQLGVKLASWGASRAAPANQQPDYSSVPQSVANEQAYADEEVSNAVTLLQEQDESELFCWVALVMTAAQLAGLQPLMYADGKSAPALTSQGDSEGERYQRGMQGFVRQALGMWRNGMTLQRLFDLQNAASQTQQMSAVQYTMQQYTRIAIMALDLMAAEQLIPMPTASASAAAAVAAGDSSSSAAAAAPASAAAASDSSGSAAAAAAAADSEDHAEEEEGMLQSRIRPTGYTSTFVNGPIVCVLPSAAQEAAGGVPAARRLAVRIAVGFMGAVLSGATGYASDKFVESVYMAYSQGWTASEILSQISEDDLSQTGGLVPVVSSSGGATGGGSSVVDEDKATSSGGDNLVNKQLFASWLSTVYMALARLGAAFPEGQQHPGWAWAGMGDATEAAGLDAFVQGALRRSILQLLPAADQGTAGAPFKATSSIEDPSRTPTPPPTRSTSTALGRTQQLGDMSTSAAADHGKQGYDAIEGASNASGPLPLAEATVDLLDPFMARASEDSSLIERLQQERRAAAEEYAATGRLRGKSVPDTLVRMQDEELAMTSSAIKLLSAQTQLVRTTLAVALRLQQQQQQQQAQ